MTHPRDARGERMRTKRCKIMSGFGVLAGSLAIASTAYACTFFIGKMTVTNSSGETVTSYGCSKNGTSTLAEQHVVSSGPNGIVLNRLPIPGQPNANFTITVDSTGASPPPGLFCNGTSPLGDATPPYDRGIPPNQTTPLLTYDVCIATLGYTAFSDFPGVPPWVGAGCKAEATLDGGAGIIGWKYPTQFTPSANPATSSTYTVPSTLAGNVPPMQGVIQIIDSGSATNGWANQVPVLII